MAELQLNNLLLFTFICYYQLELFFSVCYINYIQLSKFFKHIKKTENSSLLFSQSNNNFFTIFLSTSVCLLKGSTQIPLLLILLINIFIIYLNTVLTKLQYTKSFGTNFYSIILSFMVSFLITLNFVDSFLNFFFFIELYGVFYYFTFLTTYSLSNQTLLKYKNGLLLLLWNNFLTTVFLALSCFFLIQKFGTSNFNELSILTNTTPSIYLFFLGLSWKLGLPIFHFFKLEVYKYLLRENVFLFSIITTLFNLIIIYFFLFQSVVFSTMYLNNILIIPVLFTVILIVSNLKLHNILHYFAVSSMLTLTTVICLFII